jgi:flagellar basal-body rod protein FlgB
MYENLDLIRTSAAMAQHAGARQAIIAANIANADTPGYRAMGLPPFAAALRDGGPALARTRPGHLGASPLASAAESREGKSEPSPNGNSVSIEQEMLASVESMREHSRALAIWRHSISVIRTSLGR